MNHPFKKELLQTNRTIVVKVGTQMLINNEGQIQHPRINRLVKNLYDLRKEGFQVVLVSSGAVGMGMPRMGFSTRPRILADKQASAAVGQIQLMAQYAQKFQKHKQEVAQILLSGDDFHNQKRFENIKNTVEALFAKGVIPIINENDTISTEEIKVGDNDKLSSHVAHFLEACMLIILSDTPGLYTKNPKVYPNAKLIPIVEKITPAIEKLGSGAGSVNSVGGMRAKLRAIKQATQAGTPVLLTNDTKTSFLSLLEGNVSGTIFLPEAKKLSRRLRWLGYVAKPKGKIWVDEGGVKALTEKQSSLLAVGIRKVTGSFEKGAVVEILDPKNRGIGRGRVNYSSLQIKKIQGVHTPEIKKLLGVKNSPEVIHRDYLVLYP